MVGEGYIESKSTSKEKLRILAEICIELSIVRSGVGIIYTARGLDCENVGWHCENMGVRCEFFAKIIITLEFMAKLTCDHHR